MLTWKFIWEIRVKTVGTTVTFSGTFTNNGTYMSDPSTQNFTDLVTGASGAIVAGAGDIYNASGNVVNSSAQNATFDMSHATLTLQGTVDHQLTWAGVNLGATTAGYMANFAIGTLELQAGGSLDLQGGSDEAVYVSVLNLDGGLGQISSIAGNGEDIYYDPAQPGNGYLKGGTYVLQGGGSVSPVPEPGTWGIVLAGLAMLMGLQRARKRTHPGN